MQNVGRKGVILVRHCLLFAANTLSVLSAALPVCCHGYSHSLASEGSPFFRRSLSLRKFSTSLGPFTGAGPASAPLPLHHHHHSRGLGVFMKLLNEAETGHLCSDADDHACRWHGQTDWHFGANYADFTLAKV